MGSILGLVASSQTTVSSNMTHLAAVVAWPYLLDSLVFSFLPLVFSFSFGFRILSLAPFAATFSPPIATHPVPLLAFSLATILSVWLSFSL